MRLVFASKSIVAVLLAGGILTSASANGSDLSFGLTGDLLGTVLDPTGIPQMGATVELSNKYRQLIAKTRTAPDGRFAFAGLPVDSYSVHVSLASFLPASQDKVAVKAGLDSVLQIHLATLFSKVEVTYKTPTGAMSEDWKWVLRSSPATRPINRLLPDTVPPGDTDARTRIFSETHAMLSVSGGESGFMDSDQMGSDLGTGFALSTNILGKNQLQVAGTFGQNAELGPSDVALCAIYSRTDTRTTGAPPEVTLTVAQIGGIGAQAAGGALNAAGTLGVGVSLRTMSLSFYNVADLFDNLHLEYGMTGESVEYRQHTSRVSPFVRATADLGQAGAVIAAYSDGGRPDELSAHQQHQTVEMDAPDDDLAGALNSLARMPQVSDHDGRMQLQRTQNYEVGYQKVQGSRTYSVSSFFERVSNGRLNVAGDLSSLSGDDLLSDGTSMTSAYNIGRYNRSGYLASVNQRINDSLDFALAYGRMDGFTSAAESLGNQVWTSNQRFLNESAHNVASANVKETVHHSGTRILANYGWVDARTALPRHTFTTQDTRLSPGLNIAVRQPLPSFFGMPGHLELSADLRNLLAQGYLPINSGGGQQLLIVESPRCIRGGLSFTF